MADKRLEDIRTSDDAESKVNVELIEWLKTSGVNWLLVVLVVVIIFRGYLWWGERRERIRDQAWADLAGANLPASLESLADRVKGIDSVSELALLRAAYFYHHDLLRDETLELIPEAPTLSNPDDPEPKPAEDDNKPKPRMTAEERRETLDRMEGLYRRVLESTAAKDRVTNWKEELYLEAMFGLAAVAEMRGDFTRADEWFTRIESEAAVRFPDLATLAAAWRADTDSRTPIEFFEQSVLNAALRDTPPDPAGDAGTTAPAGTEADTATEPADPATTDDPAKAQDDPTADGSTQPPPAEQPESPEKPEKPDAPPGGAGGRR